jgi:hypothetical protein
MVARRRRKKLPRRILRLNLAFEAKKGPTSGERENNSCKRFLNRSHRHMITGSGQEEEEDFVLFACSLWDGTATDCTALPRPRLRLNKQQHPASGTTIPDDCSHFPVPLSQRNN